MTAQTDMGTRDRLLETAGQVFAERGYRAATIREICRRAGANIAAVNYHFRDKETLYAEVLRYAHRYSIETYPPDGGLGPDTPARERLAAFIRSFIRRLTDQGRPAWHGMLMIRELTEPTRTLDTLIEQSVRPQFELVCGLVREMLGPGANDRQVRLSASSIVGQCMHFQMARRVLSRLVPGLEYDDATIEAIIAHVARFSLGGLDHLARGPEGGA